MPAKAKALVPGRTEAQVLEQVLAAAAVLGLQLERRNTGGATDGRGQYVRFNEPGSSDLSGTLPDGRRLDVEVKREGYRPGKSGRFATQLARLQKVNELGGVAFWTDDATVFLRVAQICMRGGWVVEHGDRFEVIDPEVKA